MLTGTGTVRIVVEDINDHNPEFLQSRYRAEVAENSPVDTQVVKVSAFDNDNDDNALIRYSFKWTSDQFRIDSSSGQIFTRTRLDREEQSEYELVVVASDSSLINPRTAYANVTITVSDVNDNAPQFSKAMPTTVYVPDNTQPGIGKIHLDRTIH